MFKKLNRIFLFFCLGISISLFTACLPLREINKSFNEINSPSSKAKKDVNAEAFDSTSDKGQTEYEIYKLLKIKDFNAIDRIADEARKNKARLTGGYWKIDSIYAALTTIYMEYQGEQLVLKVTDESWITRIELLKTWKAQSPQSITARVALAEAYLNYGWFARGFGYANTVSNEDRKLLEERIALAENELFEAKDLNEMCPRWYREALFIGMATSWSSDEFNAVFEEAIKFEPNYLQFYLVKSEKITPKWGGSQEEWQTFVDSLPSKLNAFDSDESNIIYFVVVAGKMNDPSLSLNFETFSKERIKQGFIDLQKKYGADNYRLNQYALLSCLIQDFPAAHEAFKQIGIARESEIWDEQQFNMMKQTAEKLQSSGK